MRTINKLFYLLTAASLLGFASCQQAEETFEPGEKDNVDCEGVYFPKQDKIEESLIFDPTQDKLDTIFISRTNEDGALTVKPTVTLSANGEVVENTVFKVSDAKFEDGQVESFLAIDFSEAKEGVQYELHLSIEGDQYSSKYSSSLKACDYKVMCVAYIDFVSPADSTKPAKITFTQGHWGEVHTAYMKYYEVDGVRHCITYGEETAATEAEQPSWSYKGGFWGIDPDQHLEFLWYQEDDEECSEGDGSHPHTIPAGNAAPEGAELITFPHLQTYYLNSSAGQLYMVDYWWYQKLGGYARPYLHFLDANSLYDNASYYDGNGGFYFWVLGYCNAGRSGWWPQDYDVVGIAEGFTRADYTLKLTAGITEDDESGNNVVPIDFKVGADVASVAYTIVEGSLASAQVANEAALIIKDSVDRKYATFVDAAGVSFTDGVAAPATGHYTLVAVGFDKKKENKSTASVEFDYLLTGETSEVIFNVTAGTTEKYASRGYSSDTSIEYTISGTGITGAVPFVYSMAEVEAEGGIDAVVAEIKDAANTLYSWLSDKDYAGNVLSESALADANDGGYSDIVSSGITPGTLYYVVVWATNGYDNTVKYATTTTTGDPLPIYQNFTVDSWNDDAELANANAWVGKWNLYGIDYYEPTSLRQYLGKSTIALSDTPAEGPDDYGLYDEYVTVTGLFGDVSWLEEYNITLDDRLEMDVYGGAMYTCSNKLYKDDVFEDCTVYLYSKGQGTPGWNYAHYYWTCFIPVLDGYYAFVDTEYGASYNFTGLGLRSAGSGWLATAYDLLLVDPAKDDNGVAPAAISKAVNTARKRFDKSLAKTEKLEWTGKRAIREAIADYMKEYKSTSHCITLEGVTGLEPVAGNRVIATHNIGKGTSAKSAKGKDEAPTMLKNRF